MGSEPIIRARALIVQDGAVALIERRKSSRGDHYFVFPGGRVEAGESPAEAAAREVAEELGLIVAIHECIAEVTYGETVQHYFRATVQGGTFGTGTGPEVLGLKGPESGTYAPVWMPLDAIPRHIIYPRVVAELVHNVAISGWPKEMFRYRDSR